jgi:hypothetical protein
MTEAEGVGWDQNGYYGDWLGRGVDWIRLDQDRDRWRAVANAVVNLRVLTPRSWFVCNISVTDYTNTSYVVYKDGVTSVRREMS